VADAGQDKLIQERNRHMSAKRALITGITGQDGSYLAELLLAKGYEVHGIVRRVALEDPTRRLGRIAHLLDRLSLHAASLESFPSVYRVFGSVRPDECYHLAAQSFVSYSFDDEFSTLNTNVNGTHFILAALKDVTPQCRFYFAGSSEMFGKAEQVPQTEATRFHPRSAELVYRTMPARPSSWKARTLRRCIWITWASCLRARWRRHQQTATSSTSRVSVMLAG